MSYLIPDIFLNIKTLFTQRFLVLTSNTTSTIHSFFFFLRCSSNFSALVFHLSHHLQTNLFSASHSLSSSVLFNLPFLHAEFLYAHLWSYVILQYALLLITFVLITWAFSFLFSTISTATFNPYIWVLFLNGSGTEQVLAYLWFNFNTYSHASGHTTPKSQPMGR